MKKIIILIIVICFSCTSSNHRYFKYDELIHYRTNITTFNEMDVYENRVNSKLAYLKSGVILQNIPYSIKDTTFIDSLEKMGFIKKEIQKRKFGEIDKIFVEKDNGPTEEYGCEPIYNDILIFKLKNKTIGIAKICLTCHQKIIKGSKANIENFGGNNDYPKLKKLLDN